MSSNNPVSEPAAAAANPVSVGGQLRHAREQAGLGVDELARRLCMTADKLEALERDDFERLAGATYVRGYIRNTCKELGLDAAPVLETFAQQVPVESAVHVPEMPRGAAMPRGGQPSEGGSLFAPAVLVLAMAAAGGYWWFGVQGANVAPAVDPAMAEATPAGRFTTEVAPASKDAVESEFDTFGAADPERMGGEIAGIAPEESAVDPVPADIELYSAQGAPAVAVGATVESIDDVESAVTPAPAVTAVAEAPSDIATSVEEGAPLSLTFSEESWVEVTDAAGNKLLAKLQPAGSTVELTGEAPFNLMLGNAAATTVSYAGEVVDSAPLGNRRTRKLIVGG
ncbi:RodZ domain-containing protein [Microbulbifer sp. HZ11]|uniref:RodZ domain-containing protein n=1 Tax=unclassified Microbulbifer TaxID=2619833 RepID=UPI0005BC13BB|nr:RodZ domain-containing protein [Microbulbifer sp. HZ11]